MNLALFTERLETIKKLDKKLDALVKSFNENNPFLDDACGVRSSALSDLIYEHVYTLFVTIIKEGPRDFIEKGLRDFIEYYLYDHNYGGTIIVDSIEYNLEDYSQLYNYLKLCPNSFLALP